MSPLITLLSAASAFALSVQVARAQVQAAVAGRVVDQITGAPLASAGVAVADQATGAAVTGAVTGPDGRFVVAGLPPGDYRVSISHEGYAVSVTEVFIGAHNENYSTGEIRLAPAGEVEELVVAVEAGDAPAIGTTVFRMDDNIARSGGSVQDALRALPGVTIGEDGQVNLRGSDRVPVLIDGRPSALTGFGNQSGLDSIQASNIERIEIINNPSARFDAAGMAGIINIVYREDRKLGLHGDLGMALGLGALSHRRADIPSELGSFDFNPRYAPSLNLNYNRENSSYFLQAELINRRDLPNNEFTTRFYDDGRIRYSQIPENRKQTRAVVRAGGDWRPSERHEFSLSGSWDREHHNDYANIPYLDQQLRRTRLWFWTEDEVTGFFNVDGTYKHHFATPGHTLSLNVQYVRGWEDESYFLNEESSVRNGTDATHIVANEHTFPVSLDYVRPMRTGRLEVGAKLQLRKIDDTYDVTRGFRSIIYPGLGNFSHWRENIYAGYANLVRETPRYAIEAGVRAEQTDVAYDIASTNIYYPRSDRYDYFKLFTNARLTWNLSDSTRASVFYNNRVDRPGEADLRIFPKYDDPELLKVGNPYLRPQFTRTYEARLEQDWDGGQGSVSLFRRSITDPFTRVYAIDPTATDYEVINKIFANTGHGTQTGLEVIAAHRFSPGVNLSGSFNWYRNRLDAFDVRLLFPVPRTVPLAASKGSTWDLKLNTQIELPWNVQFQGAVTYYAPRNIAQGRQSARSSVDLGLTRMLFENRAELSLTATDVFNQFGVEQEIYGQGFTALYQNFYQTQAVSLALKYSF